MAAHDIFRFINELDAPTTQGMIERLEVRANNPIFAGLREAYLVSLRLAPDAQVLDLGCGTGVVGRALARRDGFVGRLVGIDQSPALIAAARRLAIEEGLGRTVEFHLGDAHALDYADARFDAVIAHTLLSHVADPLAVLREAARVLKPRGRLAVFDGDYASLSFGCSDPAMEQAVEQALLEVLVNNPRVMRDLPRLLGQAGLQTVEASGHVYAEIGAGSYVASRPQVYGRLLKQRGALPAEMVDRWMAEQQQALAQGTFFGTCNYYVYIAHRKDCASLAHREGGSHV
jgi:SAM-dependent methyltransferase